MSGRAWNGGSKQTTGEGPRMSPRPELKGTVWLQGLAGTDQGPAGGVITLMSPERAGSSLSPIELVWP